MEVFTSNMTISAIMVHSVCHEVPNSRRNRERSHLSRDLAEKEIIRMYGCCLYLQLLGLPFNLTSYKLSSMVFLKMIASSLIKLSIMDNWFRIIATNKNQSVDTAPPRQKKLDSTWLIISRCVYHNVLLHTHKHHFFSTTVTTIVSSIIVSGQCDDDIWAYSIVI